MLNRHHETAFLFGIIVIIIVWRCSLCVALGRETHVR